MRHELADLGAFADAAWVQRESLPFAENDRDRACGRALEDVDDWRETGLGRQYAEELFLLTGMAGGELGRECSRRRTAGAVRWPRLPLVVLRAAAEAAGDVTTHWRELRDAEQRRIGR